MPDRELYATDLGGHGAVDGGPPTRDDGCPWAQTVSIHDIIRAAETTSAASGCVTTARLPA